MCIRDRAKEEAEKTAASLGKTSALSVLSATAEDTSAQAEEEAKELAAQKAAEEEAQAAAQKAAEEEATVAALRTDERDVYKRQDHVHPG